MNELWEYTDHVKELQSASDNAGLQAPYWLLDLYVNSAPENNNQWALFAVRAANAVMARKKGNILLAIELEEEISSALDDDAFYLFYEQLVVRSPLPTKEEIDKLIQSNKEVIT